MLVDWDSFCWNSSLHNPLQHTAFCVCVCVRVCAKVQSPCALQPGFEWAGISPSCSFSSPFEMICSRVRCIASYLKIGHKDNALNAERVCHLTIKKVLFWVSVKLSAVHCTFKWAHPFFREKHKSKMEGFVVPEALKPYVHVSLSNVSILLLLISPRSSLSSLLCRCMHLHARISSLIANPVFFLFLCPSRLPSLPHLWLVHADSPVRDFGCL